MFGQRASELRPRRTDTPLADRAVLPVMLHLGGCFRRRFPTAYTFKQQGMSWTIALDGRFQWSS